MALQPSNKAIIIPLPPLHSLLSFPYPSSPSCPLYTFSSSFLHSSFVLKLNHFVLSSSSAVNYSVCFAYLRTQLQPWENILVSSSSSLRNTKILNNNFHASGSATRNPNRRPGANQQTHRTDQVGSQNDRSDKSNLIFLSLSRGDFWLKVDAKGSFCMFEELIVSSREDQIHSLTSSALVSTYSSCHDTLT